jgi:HAD superfamily hydrolase (TIGR01509 family)
MLPALIIFDFDGVIADSEAIANQLLADYLTSIGTPTTLEDSMRLFMGKRFEDTKLKIVEWTGRPFPEDFENTYRSTSRVVMRRDVGPIRGIKTFLERHQDIARCVASSSSLEWLDHCVEKFGFRHHFGSNLFSATAVKHGKPSPDIFFHAAEKMCVEPSRSLVIEDSPTGILGAKAAGMTAIGFLAGSHIRDGHRERLLAAGADHIMVDYSDLERWLASFRP